MNKSVNLVENLKTETISDHAGIMTEARNYFEQVKAAQPDQGITKSGIWSAENKYAFWGEGRERSLVEAVRIAQEGKLITENHFTHTKEFGLALDEMLRCLESLGFKLFQSPERFCESPLSSERISIMEQGRRISTDFLYKLIIAWRLPEAVKSGRLSVLEIGGGLGTLGDASSSSIPASVTA